MGLPAPLLLPAKPVADNRLWDFDFGQFPELTPAGGETVASATCTVVATDDGGPADLPIASVAVGGTHVQVRLTAGGTAGRAYTLALAVTTSAGHVLGQQYSLTLY